MAATAALMPISSASSSMHSWSIMVESMSAIRIFLRRAVGLLHDDVDRLGCQRCAQRRPRPRRARRRPARSRSQAMPSASQTIALAPTDREAICASAADRARRFGMGDQRGDERHGNSGMGKGGSLAGDGSQGRDPDSRADRERQVGAGARYRRARGRRHRQRRFHAGLFGARRADGAADRRRTASARRIALYGHVHPVDRLFDRRLAARRRRAWSPKGELAGGGRSSSAAPGSISGRWPRAFRRCPTFRQQVRDRWR